MNHYATLLESLCYSSVLPYSVALDAASTLQGVTRTQSPAPSRAVIAAYTGSDSPCYGMWILCSSAHKDLQLCHVLTTGWLPLALSTTAAAAAAACCLFIKCGTVT
jgi:hypothetical protein